MTDIPTLPSSPVVETNSKGSKTLSSKNLATDSKNIFVTPYGSVFITLILLGFLFGISFFIAYANIHKEKSPETYEDCIKSKGSYIRESYPAVCVSRKGKEFIQPLSPDEQKLLESQFDESKKDTSAYRCTPKFVIENGPELTASQVYAQECFKVQTKNECEKVDIYRADTQNFGNSDGTPDCIWTE